MRITEKGQVTIPIAFREEFGFLPHTDIEFVRNDEGELVVRKAKAKRKLHGGTHPLSLSEHLRQYSKYLTMTTEEVMELTRGE